MPPATLEEHHSIKHGQSLFFQTRYKNPEGENTMFQHILCPTDMKARSKPALKKAIQIAHQFGAKITLLNVHPEFMNREEREMLRVSAEKLKEKFRQTAVESKEEMLAIIVKLHAEDIAVEYLLREGKPENTIAKVAESIGADLIVMCTDGRDNLKDFVTGTISENVINSLICPVLIIPCKQ
jgi:nucleotide-binding universal stress UspA family protein